MIKTFKKAKEFVFSHIPNSNFKFQGSNGFERSRYFMSLIGNPQNNIKIVHVSGTSGKGSTSYFLESLFRYHGFKTGLYTSPHIIDITERIIISGTPIEESIFVDVLNDIVPAIEKMKKSKYQTVTYFEILVGMAFKAFEKMGIDIAIVEVGMGGLLDTTNTIENEDKINVISSIGLDHVEFLGNTLEKIAFQKAGIIKKNNLVIALKQSSEIMKVIEKKSNTENARITKMNPSQIEILSNNQFGSLYNFEGFVNIELTALGGYQIINSALALKAFIEASKFWKFEAENTKVYKALKSVKVPARFDLRQVNGENIIFDGAHNSQKIENFLSSLSEIYPNQKFHFLLGLKKGKEIESIIKPIIKFADSIILTSFFSQYQDIKSFSETPEDLEKILIKENYKNYQIEKNIEKAFELFLKKKGSQKVVTGSLLMISEIYEKIIEN
jgi:dihydrofolate synthase/folylpolyglutamate synthase